MTLLSSRRLCPLHPPLQPALVTSAWTSSEARKYDWTNCAKTPVVPCRVMILRPREGQTGADQTVWCAYFRTSIDIVYCWVGTWRSTEEHGAR